MVRATLFTVILATGVFAQEVKPRLVNVGELDFKALTVGQAGRISNLWDLWEVEQVLDGKHLLLWQPVKNRGMHIILRKPTTEGIKEGKRGSLRGFFAVVGRREVGGEKLFVLEAVAAADMPGKK